MQGRVHVTLLQLSRSQDHGCKAYGIHASLMAESEPNGRLSRLTSDLQGRKPAQSKHFMHGLFLPHPEAEMWYSIIQASRSLNYLSDTLVPHRALHNDFTHAPAAQELHDAPTVPSPKKVPVGLFSEPDAIPFIRTSRCVSGIEHTSRCIVDTIPPGWHIPR